LGVTPLEFCQNLLHQQTRFHGILYGVVCMILNLAVLAQYRRVTDTTSAYTTLA